MDHAARRALLAQNLANVQGRITAALRRSGRPDGAARLVAVSKYASLEVTRALNELGCSDLGESRPQSLWAKAEQLSDRSIRWHMIGHLQRNKVERTLACCSLLHAGDSLRLLEAVDTAAGAAGRAMPVLLEVNISGDAAKHGFAPDEVEAALNRVSQLQNVRIEGLMAMSGLESSLDEARREFAALRELRERLQRVAPANISLTELSMGMSDDFEAAIEEGATLVRVGSALFAGLHDT